LADTLAMGRAFLALHRATGERVWLDRAAASARFVGSRFRDTKVPGFASAANEVDARRPPRDENALLARFAVDLAERTGDAEFRRLADEAMRVAVTPELARQPSVGVVLLADLELRGKTRKR